MTTTPKTLLTHADAHAIANRLLKIPRAEEADLRTIFLGEGMLPTAVEDALIRFPNDGSEAAISWARRIKDSVPHWYPVPDASDDLPAELVEAACSAPTVNERATARAALYRLAGPELYAKVLAAWGCSPANLKPGTNPKSGKQQEQRREDVSDDRNNNDAHLSSNPWSANFRGSDAERNSKIAFFIKKGSKVAEGMAKAAGTTVGKPLRKSA